MQTDLIIALHHFCADWHNGQWSRGYRIQCHVQRYARRHNINIDRQTYASRLLYQQLAKHYANKI